MYFVERINQIMEMRKMQVTSPLIEHGELIQNAIDWMQDVPSKVAFEKELTFKGLLYLIGEDDAIKYAGNMPRETFNNALQTAKKMHIEGKLPEINLGNMSEYIIYYVYATTFLFKQYIYPPHVDIQSGTNDGAGDIFLDCGGGCGETSIWAILSGASKAYTFEPSPENQKLLKENILHHKLEDRIEHIPVALGKEIGKISFEQLPDNPLASRVITNTSQTSIELPVTTIDAWCAENKVKPNFIKMDIEGAEVNALIGAQNIIRENKPRLAICLYHNMSDMWNVPNVIKQICPEYHFWCRKNAAVGEFVLYGKVPQY